MNINNYLYNRKLKKADLLNCRNKKMLNLSDIQSVLVFISIDALEEKNNWDRYFTNLSQKNRSYNILYYLKSDEIEEEEKSEFSQIIMASNKNIFGFVKLNDSVKTLLSREYHLLLDLNVRGNKLLNVLFVGAKASLRVGGDFNDKIIPYLDLKLKTDRPIKPKLFIDQVLYFLGKINKNGNK